MVEAGVPRREQGRDGGGHIERVARRADLVGHDPQRLALPRQPQHRLDEVPSLSAAAPDAVQAAGADDEVARAEAAHEILAGELAEAVDADRPRGVGLGVGCAAGLVEPEDVIAAEVDEGGPEVAADDGQLADAPGVDGEGGRRLRLGPVHEVVGGAVDDGVGPQRGEGGADGLGPGEVELFAA
jgi:hypothetical protein